MDDFIAENNIDKIDFIKVDIEGYEYNFLKGGIETIKKNMPFLLMEIEEHRLIKFGCHAVDVFKMLSNIGYDYKIITQDKVIDSPGLEKSLTISRDFIFFKKGIDLKY